MSKFNTIQIKLSDVEVDKLNAEYGEYNARGIRKQRFFLDRLLDEKTDVKKEQNIPQRVPRITVTMTAEEKNKLDNEFDKKYSGMFTKEYFYTKKLMGGK